MAIYLKLNNKYIKKVKTKMYYISVEVGDIDDYLIEKKRKIRCLNNINEKTNIRLPFYVTLTHNGDWIIYDTNTHCILTEKCSALIHLRHLSKADSNKFLFSKYNITKFLLLKQILTKYLTIDLLNLITYLMD